MVKKFALVNLVLVLGLLFGAVAFAADDIVAAANGYFSGGTKNISAADLYDVLNDGDPSNDPMIISVRTADDYAKGHIKGAVRYDLPELFKSETLATFPMDKKIVVYCYTGQNASWVTAALRMLGYDAWNLSFGMSGWSANPDVYVRRFDPANVPNYPTVTEASEATETYSMPAPAGDTVQAAALNLFTGGLKYIQVAALYDNLNDGDASNDPMVVSVRSAADYAAGHIKGAVNMDPKTLFTAENLAKLPADRQIVVYCYTGQTSAQVAAALRMLGYDAWSMQFGMQAWTTDASVYVKRFDASTVPDYPTEGTAAAAAAPASLPTTGGAPLPVGAVVTGLGFLSLGLGVALRRRRAA